MKDFIFRTFNLQTIMVIMMIVVVVSASVVQTAAWRYKTMRGGRRLKMKEDTAWRHV